MTDDRRVRVTWQGGYRTEVDVRGVHRLQGDEMPEYGGADSGPMPTELLLASLGSCLCLAVAHVAKKRRLTLTDLSVDVDAVKDMKEFRFQDIHLRVRADLPPHELSALVEQAKRYCFVSNTMTTGCTINYVTESTVQPVVIAGADV